MSRCASRTASRLRPSAPRVSPASRASSRRGPPDEPRRPRRARTTTADARAPTTIGAEIRVDERVEVDRRVLRWGSAESSRRPSSAAASRRRCYPLAASSLHRRRRVRAPTPTTHRGGPPDHGQARPRQQSRPGQRRRSSARPPARHRRRDRAGAPDRRPDRRGGGARRRARGAIVAEEQAADDARRRTTERRRARRRRVERRPARIARGPAAEEYAYVARDVRRIALDRRLADPVPARPLVVIAPERRPARSDPRRPGPARARSGRDCYSVEVGPRSHRRYLPPGTRSRGIRWSTPPSRANCARAHLDGTVVDPGHRDYDRLRRVYNAVIERRPGAIVQAATASDVQKVVRIAADTGLPLAVRCGGHSFAGLGTCDDGIVCDLSRMNAVLVDPQTRTVDVGGGALLGDVDAAGERYGLVTPAGVVSHTGVGGLTLGGGMGYLSRRFGLTIDNLIEADIVTADGRLSRVDADEQPDLFWAIRGGGGNFGVVTRFKFRMHDLGPVSIRRWTHPAAAIGGDPDAIPRRGGDAPRELTTAFIATRDELLLRAIWTGSRSARMRPWTASRSHEGSRTPRSDMTFVELQRVERRAPAMGSAVLLQGRVPRRDGRSCHRRHRATRSRTCRYPDLEVYCLQLGGAVGDIDEDATAYSGRAAAFYWISQGVWDRPDDDERAIAWCRRTARRLGELSMSANYVNEQADTGVAHSAYGESKYRRLAQLKWRYDPMNVFRLNQNIEPIAGLASATIAPCPPPADAAGARPEALFQPPPERQPLAARMRPRDLEEFVGQEPPRRRARAAPPQRRARPPRRRSCCGARRGPARPASPACSRTRSAPHFATLSAVMSGVAEVRATIAEAQERLDAPRHAHRPVPRRDPPLQQGPAGRAPAARRGRHGHPHRRDDREPLLRGQRRAPVADARLAARAADRRGGRRPSSGGRSTDAERGLAGRARARAAASRSADDAVRAPRRRSPAATRGRRSTSSRARPRWPRTRRSATPTGHVAPAARGRRGRRPAARPRLRPRRRRPLRHGLARSSRACAATTRTPRSTGWRR